jgi:hypothetical protein
MPIPWRWILGFCCSTALIAEVQGADTPPSDHPQVYARRHFQPFLKQYCGECHFGAEPEGELRLDQARTSDALVEQQERFARAVRMLRSGQMPPKDSPQPPAKLRTEITQWLDNTIHNVDCDGVIDPGRETIRRLNRVEYANTIRDLLGVKYDAAQLLPADDVGYGFDNIGDVLSVSPLLVEKYLQAAQVVSQRAILANPRDALATTWITGSAMRSGGLDRALPESKG